MPKRRKEKGDLEYYIQKIRKIEDRMKRRHRRRRIDSNSTDKSTDTADRETCQVHLATGLLRGMDQRNISPQVSHKNSTVQGQSTIQKAQNATGETACPNIESLPTIAPSNRSELDFLCALPDERRESQSGWQPSIAGSGARYIPLSLLEIFTCKNHM
ncbi:hypothetical protein ACJJTC_019257 [Scirpophaga incertulas]